MRIIGHIEHPDLKITIFKADNRTSVKFENEGYEQTYKLGIDDRMSDAEAVRRWIDAEFLAGVAEQFQAMHSRRLGAYRRAFPPEPNATFEEII